MKGWTDDFVYSLRVESGDLNLKDAAFVAATMALCQCSPVDVLMYYDARTTCTMNGMFGAGARPRTLAGRRIARCAI